LTELVRGTRKAKPTLSTVHVPPLLESGLVRESVDEKDARVKWYQLSGYRLGSSAVDRAKLRDAVLGYVQSTGVMPLAPLLTVLDIPSLAESGDAAYVDGVADRLGRLLGRLIFGPGAVAELGQLLDRHGLGRIESGPPRLRVTPGPGIPEAFLRRVVEAALKGREPRPPGPPPRRVKARVTA
jgi:hypothetical protein